MLVHGPFVAQNAFRGTVPKGTVAATRVFFMF